VVGLSRWAEEEAVANNPSRHYIIATGKYNVNFLENNLKASLTRNIYGTRIGKSTCYKCDAPKYYECDIFFPSLQWQNVDIILWLQSCQVTILPFYDVGYRYIQLAILILCFSIYIPSTHVISMTIPNIITFTVMTIGKLWPNCFMVVSFWVYQVAMTSTWLQTMEWLEVGCRKR